jgi:hypothetical protein
MAQLAQAMGAIKIPGGLFEYVIVTVIAPSYNNIWLL